MKAIKTISLDVDIITSPEYLNLVKENKLSPLINQFLRSNLNIQSIAVDKDENELKSKVSELKAQISMFEFELNRKREQRDKELKDHPTSEGWFWHDDRGQWVRRLG